MASKSKKPEVQNWYKDRYQYVIMQRKALLFITLGSLICTLCMAVVITQLIPLKSIEPYVIQIDQRTGITQTVEPLTATDLTANEAVNNYFIVHYIRARESYSSSDVTMNYNLVRLMSEDFRVYPKFRGEADPNNPASNITRFGANGTRKIKIKSITYLNPQLVQVRILISERFDRAADNADLHRIVLLSFEYVKMSLSTEERYLNPLGFRVTDYQIIEDTVQ